MTTGPARVRVLIDRMWPRGVSHARLAGVPWLPELAPSDDLRRWFGHVSERCSEFATRHAAELRGKRAALAALLARAGADPLTLLVAARDVDHCNGTVRRDCLARLIAGKRTPKPKVGRPRTAQPPAPKASPRRRRPRA